MKRSIAVLALLLAALAPAGAQSAGPSPAAAPSFPPVLERYEGEDGLSLAGVLAHRIRVEPLNLVATVLFALATCTPSPHRGSPRGLIDSEAGTGRGPAARSPRLMRWKRSPATRSSSRPSCFIFWAKSRPSSESG